MLTSAFFKAKEAFDTEGVESVRGVPCGHDLTLDQGGNIANQALN